MAMARPIFAFGRSRSSISLFLLALALLASQSRSTSAQVSNATARTYPNQSYFQSFGYFHRGNFTRALKSYTAAARGGLRSTEGRWIDSVCYFTMMGECHYQLGNFEKATEAYNAALELVTAWPDWMLRVDFPNTIQPSQGSERRKITWGPGTRNAMLGRFSDRHSVLFGRLRNDNVIRQGGVVAPPEFHQVHVHEIVRCTALSLRRRKELLGPICRYDNLTQRLVQALSKRIGPVNHWSTPWAQVQLALAHLGADQIVEATGLLENSLLVMGRFDHPLTATALVELGKIHWDQGRFEPALGHFFEATLAAAQFGQADTAREAFQLAAQAHLALNPYAPYAPLVLATAWAKREDYDFLQAAMMVEIADSLIALGHPEQSRPILSEAGTLIKRRDISSVALNSRLLYVNSVVEIEEGKQKSGLKRLDAALQLQLAVSRPLFQLQFVNQLYSNGTITPRIAGVLYAELLQEPHDNDWESDPLGTLAFLSAPRESFLQDWFDIVVDANQIHEAIEVSERIKRHRFLREHPLGGRLFALQWVFEAPKELLSDSAVRQRQDLVQRYPFYQQTSAQAAALLDELRAGQLMPADPDLALEQRKRLAKLSETTVLLEHHTLRIGVSRAPSEMAFPPFLKTADVQAQLAEDELAVVFHQTRQKIHAFMIARDKEAHWEIKRPSKLKSQLASVLKSVGLVDGDYAITTEQLADDKWKKQAENLGKTIFSDKQQGFWNRFEQLTIVPDGFLWHLPFEMVQITDDDGSASLLSRITIRYAPTLALSTPDRRGFKPHPRRLAIVDQLHPKEDVKLVREHFDQLNEVDQEFEELNGRIPSSSNYLAALIDDLLVLDDIKPNPGQPLQWSLIPTRGANSAETLQSWFALPWGGPRLVVLPGFHTAAEGGLKGASDGHDLFLTTTAMIANGTRTALVSRWRNGGQTTYDLLQEFYQELAHTSPARSWRRAVEVVGANEIDPEFEPRVTASDPAHTVLANHPFLSANYLLIDRSIDRDASQDEVDTAQLVPKRPADGF